LSADELVDESVKANVQRSVEELNGDPLLTHLVEEGKLKIVGAEYALHSGKVTLL
jgi:carbonic anhydrase